MPILRSVKTYICYHSWRYLDEQLNSHQQQPIFGFSLPGFWIHSHWRFLKMGYPQVKSPCVSFGRFGSTLVLRNFHAVLRMCKSSLNHGLLGGVWYEWGEGLHRDRVPRRIWGMPWEFSIPPNTAMSMKKHIGDPLDVEVLFSICHAMTGGMVRV